MLLRKSRGQLLIAPGRMKQLGKSRNDTQLCLCLVVKVKSSAVKDCTETWNVRPINQGNLDVVKQEIARVNINILFQQHKMTLHMDILYTEIRLIIFFAAKDRKLYTVSKNKTWN